MRKEMWNCVLTVATLVAGNDSRAVAAPAVGHAGVSSPAVGFVLVRLLGIWLHSS